MSITHEFGTMEGLRKDNQRLKEYAVALERTRADLWGSNEELREKIGALERGQEDLEQRIFFYKEIFRTTMNRDNWLKRLMRLGGRRRNRTDP